MVVTADFVFVHLHKCGGSFLTEALLRYVPTARRVGYHYPCWKIPDAHRHLPILGVVRNPWDFYVSYHAFQSGLLERARAANGARTAAELERLIDAGRDPWNGIDVLFEELSGRGALGFPDACRHYLSFTREAGLFDRVLERLPAAFDHRAHGEPVERGEGFRGMNLRRQDLAPFRGGSVGLYTVLFRHLFGAGEGVEFLRMETLREELLAWFERHGVAVSRELADFVRHAERVNTSAHAPYRTYYDAELAGLVARADGELIARFGYAL